MGKAKGSTSVKNVDTMSKTQKEFFDNLLTQLGVDATSSLQGLISPGDYEELFQKTYVDPAMMAYQQDVIPGIQERFGGDTAASSALNQTLAKSAENLGTMLGGQMGGFQQNQQQLQLGALAQLLGAGAQKQFEPVVTQKQGWLDPVIGGAMMLGSKFI